MSVFGWSYPPGAANDPFAPYNQEDPPCQVCGSMPECVCPECSLCGAAGDPICYSHHGLVLTQEQVLSRNKRIDDDKQRAAADAAEAEYWQTEKRGEEV